jgi:phosphoglucosamine mutase
MRDNGVKVFAGSGAKLAPGDEAWLEAEMERAAPAEGPSGALLGAIERRPEAADTYVAILLAHAQGLDLSGMKIVVDAANGATHAVGPRLFRELGAEVVAIHAEPDGLNINDGCGAVHPEDLARAVVAQRADIGFAFDGDGDRAILAGSDGSIQDGDRILYACGWYQHERGQLPGDTVVATVMSNFGLELACRDHGIRLFRTQVGDRHVVAAMREHGWQLGGEQSGHVVFGAENRWIGDGLFTALKALRVMTEAGRPFEALTAAVRPVPQVLLNVRVRQKPPLEEIPAVADRIAAAERTLSAAGRVVVRYSGTENLMRVMVEGKDGAAVDRSARDIAAAVRAAIGAE